MLKFRGKYKIVVISYNKNLVTFFIVSLLKLNVKNDTYKDM
jgi:phage-related protein